VRELLEGRVDIDSVEGSKICFSFSGDVSDEFPDELAEELDLPGMYHSFFSSSCSAFFWSRTQS